MWRLDEVDDVSILGSFLRQGPYWYPVQAYVWFSYRALFFLGYKNRRQDEDPYDASAIQERQQMT